MGCGCSSKVEPQPSKLMMWVRFPSPAPNIGRYDRGLKGFKIAHIAQGQSTSLVRKRSPVQFRVWAPKMNKDF